MNRLQLLSFILLLNPYLIFSQTTRISGFVQDSINGEKLINAHIVSSDLQSGVPSNNLGYYTIVLNRNQQVLHISYIGYNTKTITVKSLRDTVINIELSPSLYLDEVVVESKGGHRFRNFAVKEIPMKKIKEIPAMLGEVDIYKSIQLLPGVTSTWAGFSGMVVRGGGSDQNLILVDDVPIYSFSHFYGLFSVLNENSIQSVRFLKGAVPARYGSRLSSIVDIALKDGNKKKVDGNLGVGIMSGNLAVNGPLNRGKTTFSIAGRRSLYDLFTNAYYLVKGENMEGSYFGDISAKITHSISDKNKIGLSYFYSIDKYYDNSKKEFTDNGITGDLINRNGYNWGNQVLSLKWNHIQNTRLAISTTIYLSNFFHRRYTNNKFTSSSKEYISKVNFNSSIRDLGLRSDWQFFPNNANKFYFGINHTLHQFSPGSSLFYDSFSGADNVVSKRIGNDPFNLSETVGYIEYDFRISSIITANFGIRNTWLNNKGYSIMIPEPRISGTIELFHDNNLTLYYVQTSQYFHLLRSSIIELPTDLWVPATKNFPSEMGKQIGIEDLYNINNKYEISIAGYYRTMGNLVAYKEGASILPNGMAWEDKMEKGNGVSYGCEFYLAKKGGVLNGWLSYTLSLTKRKFDNINQGREYYSDFDRRHQLAITGNYKFSEKWRFGLTWRLNTGTPYSMPAYYINTPYTQLMVYEKKNNFRLPPYHRLDLGLFYTSPVTTNKKFSKEWSISVFNAYMKKNVYYRGMWGNYPGEASLFMFIPSLTYKLLF